jgi:hypothetical protein
MGSPLLAIREACLLSANMVKDENDRLTLYKDLHLELYQHLNNI